MRRRARPRVHDLQPRVRLDLELDRARSPRSSAPNRSRAEPGPGSPRRPVVERRAHDGHVGAARRQALVVRKAGACRTCLGSRRSTRGPRTRTRRTRPHCAARSARDGSRGSLIATADATRAGLGASVFPQSGGRHDEVSVGHDLRYVGSLDRRHATFFDPIEEIEQESAPGEAPLQSVRRLRRTSDRTEALGRDTAIVRLGPADTTDPPEAPSSARMRSGFDHRRERSAGLGGETGGRCNLGPTTTNVAIWGREQCEASVRGRPVHAPSVGRVPRQSHLADARADPQAGLDIDLDELAQTLMRRCCLSRVAFGRAVRDRGRACEPQVSNARSRVCEALRPAHPHRGRRPKRPSPRRPRRAPIR